MGPPPFGDGDGVVHAVHGVVDRASMGPPPFGDGDLREACARFLDSYSASMGPPPFGDGDNR